MRSWGRGAYFAAAVLAAPLAISASLALDRSGGLDLSAPLDPFALRVAYGPKDFTAAFDLANNRVTAKRERVQSFPGDWLYMEGLSRALLARARLSGKPADLVEADHLLDQAIAIAPWPAGPSMSRAGASLYLHRLEAAEAGMRRLEASAMPLQPDELNEIASMRCEIEFQRGHVSKAAKLCGASQSLSLKLRQANINAKRGYTAKAADLIESLLRGQKYSPSTLSTLFLQRASVALARGDWAVAGRWVRAADRIFPGYWLTQSFVAQQFALEGNLEEAQRRYLELASRTGNPDVMDALAGVLEARGSIGEAAGWRLAATTSWQARVAVLPEAYSTHYAEHVLGNGDPKQALALAQREYDRRPFSTPIVNYARALNHNGQPQKALAVLRTGFRAGFYTPGMLSEESSAFAALGRPIEAWVAMASAQALNPKISDPRRIFVVFDQD